MLFLEKVKLNKCTNVDIVKGDVRTAAKKYYNKCDRVVMPLPESSFGFVREALWCLKPGGVCNIYCFSSEDGQREKVRELQQTAANMGATVRIKGVHRVLPYGPAIWKMRIDAVKVR